MGDARDTAERRKGRTGRVRAEAGRDAERHVGDFPKRREKFAWDESRAVAGAQALMAISADPDLQIRDT